MPSPGRPGHLQPDPARHATRPGHHPITRHRLPPGSGGAGPPGRTGGRPATPTQRVRRRTRPCPLRRRTGRHHLTIRHQPRPTLDRHHGPQPTQIGTRDQHGPGLRLTRRRLVGRREAPPAANPPSLPVTTSSTQLAASGSYRQGRSVYGDRWGERFAWCSARRVPGAEPRVTGERKAKDSRSGDVAARSFIIGPVPSEENLISGVRANLRWPVALQSLRNINIRPR